MDELNKKVEELLYNIDHNASHDTSEDLSVIVRLANKHRIVIMEYLLSKVVNKNPVLAMMIAMECDLSSDDLFKIIEIGLPISGGGQINFWGNTSIKAIGSRRALQVFYDVFKDRREWMRYSLYYLQRYIPADDMESIALAKELSQKFID